MEALKDRRRAQAGTTMVELLVAVTIAGLSLALIVGTLSNGVLEASLAKRNAAIQAVLQYETDAVHASTFAASAAPYSECFASDDPASSPALAPAYLGNCPSSSYSLRADVSWSWSGTSTTVQVWTIAINTWPASAQPISTLQLYKVAHQ